MVRVLVIVTMMVCGLCRMAMAETVNDPGCRNWLSQIERPSGGTKERVFLKDFSQEYGAALARSESGAEYLIIPDPGDDREQQALNVEALVGYAWLLRINSPANPKAAPFHIIVGAAGNGCQILSKVETFARGYRPTQRLLKTPEGFFDFHRSACVNAIIPYLRAGGFVFPVLISDWEPLPLMFAVQNGDVSQASQAESKVMYTIAVSGALRGMWEVVYRREGPPVQDIFSKKKTAFEGRIFTLTPGSKECEEVAVGPVLPANIPEFAKDYLGLK